MKAHKTRVRALRALVIAGCLASLAVPAAATAMPPRADPPTSVRHENAAAYVPDAFAGASDESGATLDHRGLNEVSRPYTLPSGFRTDVRSSPARTVQGSFPGSIV